MAQEIAQSICDSVKASLVGQKLPSLTRVRWLCYWDQPHPIVHLIHRFPHQHTYTHPHSQVKTVVRSALEQAIVRILTPKRSTDMLRAVMAARAQGRPYTVVFVGINGVGKSTSLSKVCYYLKAHGLKVGA